MIEESEEWTLLALNRNDKTKTIYSAKLQLNVSQEGSMRSIDPVLLSKIKEQNQTIYNNANPKMSIQVSRAKDTR